jgi:hypothetical protein
MARAALLLLLLPSLALAQLTVTETSDDLDDERINIAECEATLQSNFVFNWTITTTPATTSVELRISDTSGCALPSENSAVKTQTLGTFTGATGTSAVQSAPNLAQQLAFACRAGSSRSLHVCAIGSNGATATQTVTAIVPVDTSVPTKPRVLSVSPGEGALDVVWELSSNANRYIVEATPQGGGSPVRSEEITGNSQRVSGLVNGTPYEVRVFGISEAGNASTASDPLVETPQEVNDFWEAYRVAGGDEQGGCGVGGAGALALLGLVPLALRRRAK